MTTNSNIDSSDVPGKIRDLQKVADRNAAVSAVFSTLNNAAGQTLTAAQFVGRYLDRSGAAGVSDTTPTAALLVAAVPNVAVGDVHEFVIRNRNTGTLTLVAGSGVTLEGTTTIPTVNTRRYAIRFTNVTVGTEAVTLSGVMVAAN